MRECPKCGRKAAVNFDICIYCGASFGDDVDRPHSPYQEIQKKEPKKHYYQERRKLSKRAATALNILGTAVVLLVVILLVELNGGFEFLKKPRGLSPEDQMYYELSKIQAAMVAARVDLIGYPSFSVLIDTMYLRDVEIVTYSSSTIVTQAAKYQLMERADSDRYSIFAETNDGSAHITIDQSSPDMKLRMKKRRR